MTPQKLVTRLFNCPCDRKRGGIYTCLGQQISIESWLHRRYHVVNNVNPYYIYTLSSRRKLKPRRGSGKDLCHKSIENNQGSDISLERRRGGEAEGRAPVQDELQLLPELFLRSALNKSANAKNTTKVACTLTFCGSKMEHEKGV